MAEDDDDYIPIGDEAQYRYALRETGTEVEIRICSWVMSLHISSKFRFLNDVTELSKPNAQSSDVKFSLGLAYNKDDPEYTKATVNELTIHIDKVSGNYKPSRITTLFKETSDGTNEALTLTISLRAEIAQWDSLFVPFELGFDFDNNARVFAQSRATSIIFTGRQPSSLVECNPRSLSGPDAAVKKEFRKAVRFADLGREYCTKYKYDKVLVYRLVGVGYVRDE